MPAEYIQLIIWFIIWVVITYLILLLHFNSKLNNEKKKSVSQSRNTILWEISEKVLPLLPEFPYHTKDLVFLWKGVDYVVFNWLLKSKVETPNSIEMK